MKFFLKSLQRLAMFVGLIIGCKFIATMTELIMELSTWQIFLGACAAAALAMIAASTSVKLRYHKTNNTADEAGAPLRQQPLAEKRQPEDSSPRQKDKCDLEERKMDRIPLSRLRPSRN